MAGDGDMIQVNGNVGMPLSEAGFANLSFEYKTSDPTSRSVQRDDARDLIAGGNAAVARVAQVWGSPEFKHDYKLFLNTGIDLDSNSEAYMFGNYAERKIEGGFYFRHPHTRGGIFDSGTSDNNTPDDPSDDLQYLLVGDLTGDMSGNCPTDIVVGDNVLENQRYIDEVAGNPDCFAFNEMLPGGFTPRFGGTVKDMSLAMGTKGEISGGPFRRAFI